MYQQAVQKIKYQLTTQGFTNIADFSQDGGKPYFMQDTIHMGWLGWLAFDKVVDPFVSNPQPAPSSQMNDRSLVKNGLSILENQRNLNSILSRRRLRQECFGLLFL